jgi:hypothetical protein
MIRTREKGKPPLFREGLKANSGRATNAGKTPLSFYTNFVS